MIWLIMLLLTAVGPALADYECLCNYNVELAVYDHENLHGKVLGYMYEFDCKPTVMGSENGNGVKLIQYEKQEGYVQMNTDTQVLQCQGSPSVDDLLTTTTKHGHTVTTTPITSTTPTTTPTTTSTTTTTTTPTPTTTPTTTSTTTTTTTPTPTTTPTTTRTTTTINTTAPGSIPQGHIELCPSHIQTDINLFGGFIGQFGDFCYELVSRPTQWDNAEHHCRLISQGHLVNIPDQNTQDYLVSFLANHQYVDNVWIGLSDKANETVYTWTSGDRVSFTNFESDSVDHKLNDCILMKKDGKWRDIACGVALVFGTGFGESHPYICQYNVTSKPPDIFHVLTDVILG